VRIVAASTLAAALALAVWYGLEQLLGRSIGAQIVSLAAGLGVAGLTYVGAARALRVRELQALLLLRARRADDTDER
jgi:hypothetical protein